MPRIRTLKPEHRQHRKVGPLSDREYRLWVSMILEAEDAGRLVCDAAQLRAVTWPYHPKVTVAHVETAIQSLACTGMIRLYEHGGVRYADFPSWTDHQRIDHPAKPKLPEYQHSPNPRESSRILANDPGGREVEVEGNGSGKEQGVGQAPDVPSLGSRSNGKGHGHGPAAMSTAARDLLAFLNKKAERNYQPVDTNLELIIALLRKGTTVDQVYGVIAARVRKWKGDPKMEEFLRPSTLFRASNFQQYLGELPASAFAAPTDA